MESAQDVFNKESEFEAALVHALVSYHGWEKEIINTPTEKDLVENWRKILSQNNMTKDRLNDCPLTDTEMQQILNQIEVLKTPLKLNGFVNGKTVSVKRDNPNDLLHLGKEISLKIYDRNEIAAGQSTYQIAEQPVFLFHNELSNDRRGDLMLLINGMPLIHIELKKSGIPVSQACNQIEKYSKEGVFTGLFSLVQVFVAMTPDETLYFANPGPEGRFNNGYYFHWADFNNEPINHWYMIASLFLSIPMAHQLIGFYTVADNSDNVLKVMRSYQYYAANRISRRVSKTSWDGSDVRGGYIWHTTGSGKTMTSFKSAQLIANSKDADKVIFLMDRIELGTQSYKEYEALANADESVQKTENTNALIAKLKSSKSTDTLIVTSIQKMSRIKEDGLDSKDIEKMNTKRMVFIVDEAHRSTFGEMLITIKYTFPCAMFFGFTGTPILEENQKKTTTTSMVFGKELHRYSIADGIRDGNVLGFDPYKVMTFADKDMKKAVALHEAKAKNEEDAIVDPKKKKVYYHFMNDVPMAGYNEKDGTYVKGIEDYIPTSQYLSSEHQKMVVEDIVNNWTTLSRNGKFHAIFATSSINEAVDYYRLLKKNNPNLKITALFDPNIDNEGGMEKKEEGLTEILKDYNQRYEQHFDFSTHSIFKKDVADRIAHKGAYILVERSPEKQLDLLIVVNQMLTGFDSKWVNTLYLDKELQYENIIQAFSRTNRLFGPDKPFGVIRYYRKPNTMEKNIEKAVKLYSGDRPIDLFVEKLDKNLEKVNILFNEIKNLFKSAGEPEMEKLPKETADKGQFAKLYKEMSKVLEASIIQGFNFDKQVYYFGESKEKKITVQLTKSDDLTLLQRYRELIKDTPKDKEGVEEAPYDIDGSLIEIDTGKIDTNYMNSRFEKYLRSLDNGDVEIREKTLIELHRAFAMLNQEQQKAAELFLHDIESGNVKFDGKRTFRDYINEYQQNTKNGQIQKIIEAFGLDGEKLKALLDAKPNESNINDYNRFNDLVDSVVKEKAVAYFENKTKEHLKSYKVRVKCDAFLREFVLSGGFDIDAGC